MGMYGPEFVWILHPDAETVKDWSEYADVERSKNKTGTCTTEEYEEVADRTIILDKKILYRTDGDTITASGLVRKKDDDVLYSAGVLSCLRFINVYFFITKRG